MSVIWVSDPQRILTSTPLSSRGSAVLRVIPMGQAPIYRCISWQPSDKQLGLLSINLYIKMQHNHSLVLNEVFIFFPEGFLFPSFLQILFEISPMIETRQFGSFVSTLRNHKKPSHPLKLKYCQFRIKSHLHSIASELVCLCEFSFSILYIW